MIPASAASMRQAPGRHAGQIFLAGSMVLTAWLPTGQTLNGSGFQDRE